MVWLLLDSFLGDVVRSSAEVLACDHVERGLTCVYSVLAFSVLDPDCFD
jgi:hypothetical protein